MRLRRAIATAAALVMLLVAAPEPAAARVVVTVEIAFGGVVAGGVGVFVYFAGAWETSLGELDLPTALVEVRGDRTRLGLPLPLLRFDADPGGSAEPDGRVMVDLVRWRF